MNCPTKCALRRIEAYRKAISENRGKHSSEAALLPCPKGIFANGRGLPQLKNIQMKKNKKDIFFNWRSERATLCYLSVFFFRKGAAVELKLWKRNIK